MAGKGKAAVKLPSGGANRDEDRELVPVEVKIAVRSGRDGSVTRQMGVQCMRVASAAAIFAILSTEEQAAAERIYGAHSVLLRGIGHQSSMPAPSPWESPLDPPTGGNPVEAQAALVADYLDWQRACRDQRLGVEAGVAMSIIIDGASLRQVERQLRVRNGRASEMLHEALAIYCKLKGWAVPAKESAA